MGPTYSRCALFEPALLSRATEQNTITRQKKANDTTKGDWRQQHHNQSTQEGNQRARVHTHTRTAHTYTQTHTHTPHTHTAHTHRTHAHAHTAHTHTYAPTHPRTHARTHTQPHTHTYTHTHTHTHTHLFGALAILEEKNRRFEPRVVILLQRRMLRA